MISFNHQAARHCEGVQGCSGASAPEVGENTSEKDVDQVLEIKSVSNT